MMPDRRLAQWPILVSILVVLHLKTERYAQADATPVTHDVEEVASTRHFLPEEERDERTGDSLQVARDDLHDVPPASADGHTPASDDAALPEENGFIDRMHAAVSAGVIATDRRLDSFFSDERIEEEVYGTRIRLRGAASYYRHDGFGLAEDIDAVLSLPRTAKKLQLVLTSREQLDEQDGSGLRQDDDAGDFQAALRYLIRETQSFRLQADGGAKFRPDPDPFFRVRARYLRELGSDWLFRLTQSGYVFMKDGFGETTRADFERLLDERTLLRTTTEATWSETSSGVDWEHVWVWRRQLTSRRGIALVAGIEGPTDPDFEVDMIRLIFRYRQRVWRDWLWLEFAPGLRFPREDDYDVSPGATIALDVIFGKYRRH
jgi:hypothetical protein